MNKLILILLCVFVPPLGVLVDRGLGKDFLINLILTLIFFFPGMIHALWITLKT
ncbi:YqaE/Pmp3 family membrane protein [Vibrio sp. AK197]|uniref:YqaE/Pmp3 family membrane protein n=1 Tax=Vibrio olivae TaxID=1243002 RepID=A0ABV5HQM9_9VIBR